MAVDNSPLNYFLNGSLHFYTIVEYFFIEEGKPKIMEILSSEKKLLAWSSQPKDIEITRTKGSYLYDSAGKEYIDFIMGWCVGNFGWNNEEITAKIRAYDGPAYVYPAFTYKGWSELASLLIDLTGGKLKKCFRNTGGTDAVETAMKVAIIYTKRKKFVSVEGCYHGNSIGALSIGSVSNHDIYPNLLDDCEKISKPLNAEAIAQVRELLIKQDVAAVIIEPVLTHPGIHVPETAFMQELRKICDETGTLLVMDEVATGFGRTGKAFGFEHHDITPDILCMAKALSGGQAAIGATMTTEKIGSAVEEKVSAYPTYGWHPLSTEASIASTQYFIRNKSKILSNVVRIGELLKKRISQMKFKNEIRINSLGLAMSVDVGDRSYAEKITDKCLDNGLLIEYNQSRLMLFPSLVMDEETAMKGLQILEKCI
jgi:adenosylmethionine-8-amino-7-oxononanoate aminotransferase